MIKIIFWPLLICSIHLSSCSLLSNKSPIEKKQLALFCQIFKSDGQLLRRFPGSFCLFGEQGQLLMSNTLNNELTYYDAEMRTLWTLPIHVHHQMNKTFDGGFLVLSSETHLYENKKTRFDRLVKIDVQGKIIGEFSFYKHRQELLAEIQKEKFDLQIFNWDPDNQILGEVESSHSNSAYEIPKNPKSLKYPELEDGNVILNANTYGRILILDRNLEHIIKFIKQPSHLTHDIQITDQGNLLVYNNQVEQSSPKISEIQIYNYPEKTLIWNYHRQTPEFNFPYVGSVQLINNDKVLFTDIRSDFTRAILLDYKSKQELMVTAPAGWEKTSAHQIKLLDLNSFLQKNKGP